MWVLVFGRREVRLLLHLHEISIILGAGRSMSAFACHLRRTEITMVGHRAGTGGVDLGIMIFYLARLDEFGTVTHANTKITA